MLKLLPLLLSLLQTPFTIPTPPSPPSAFTDRFNLSTITPIDNTYTLTFSHTPAPSTTVLVFYTSSVPAKSFIDAFTVNPNMTVSSILFPLSGVSTTPADIVTVVYVSDTVKADPIGIACSSCYLSQEKFWVGFVSD